MEESSTPTVGATLPTHTKRHSAVEEKEERGCSEVTYQMATGTGYVKDWGIERVSSGLIAYVVELVSICLQDVTPSFPSQVPFSLSYANVDLDCIQFHNALVAHLNNPGLKEQNRQIHDFAKPSDP